MHTMLNDFYQTLDPIAVQLGPLAIRWYGLAYIAGFVLAGVLIYRIAKRWKLGMDAYDVLCLVCFCALGIIIGARVGYCLIYGDGYYLQHPGEILAVNKGGMSFHGGLVGAVLGGIVYSIAFKFSFFTLADMVACSAPAGLLFGRCANFVNGELYGAPTDLPWGVDFLNNGVMMHPSQLYEGLLEGLVLLVILQLIARRNKPLPQGSHLGLFLALYGVFRFLLEFIRLPDAQIGYFFGTWGTMGQLLCTLMVVAGVVIVAVSLKIGREQQGRTY